jgi:ribonucleoside-diphosphate reductase beta chain
VAFGARFLREMAAEDDRYRDAIQRTLVECGPAADGVLEPRWVKEQGIEPIGGVDIDETRAFALKALERRLKVIGLQPVG